jgi:hypothetical protein
MRRESLRRVGAATTILCAALFAAGSSSAASWVDADGVVNLRSDKGLSARVFPSKYLSDRTACADGRGTLALEDDLYLTLITDIDDPLIFNKGDGEFHPIGEDLVVDCLERIEYPAINLEVEVFVLPYPRVNQISSSASGRRIFLSPQVLEISREGAAYIVAHEMGHVFQYRYLPERLEDRWNQYRLIRGIEDQEKFSDTASHAYRPQEIFAEDFRVLFGGPAAYFGGRVENPDIPSPVAVVGLEEFFLALAPTVSGAPVIVSLDNYPNPFNPQTEIRVRLSDRFVAGGEAVTVRIYDVSGALVRDLFHGRPDGPELEVIWDGCDGRGTRVASSTYFGVVEAGNARMTTKLLMIK